MNLYARHVALRAAAKVTLSAAFVGCGGTTGPVTVDASDLDAHPAPDALARLDAPDAPDAPPLACPDAVADPKAIVSESRFACCATFLEGSLASSDSGPAQVDASSATSLPCCASAIAYVNRTPSALASLAAPVVASCCHALTAPDAGPPNGPACSPWGPPVPPAMPGVRPMEVA